MQKNLEKNRKKIFSNCFKANGHKVLCFHILSLLYLEHQRKNRYLSVSRIRVLLKEKHKYYYHQVSIESCINEIANMEAFGIEHIPNQRAGDSRATAVRLFIKPLVTDKQNEHTI